MFYLNWDTFLHCLSHITALEAKAYHADISLGLSMITFDVVSFQIPLMDNLESYLNDESIEQHFILSVFKSIQIYTQIYAYKSQYSPSSLQSFCDWSISPHTSLLTFMYMLRTAAPFVNINNVCYSFKSKIQWNAVVRYGSVYLQFVRSRPTEQ